MMTFDKPLNATQKNQLNMIIASLTDAEYEKENGGAISAQYEAFFGDIEDIKYYQKIINDSRCPVEYQHSLYAPRVKPTSRHFTDYATPLLLTGISIPHILRPCIKAVKFNLQIVDVSHEAAPYKTSTLNTIIDNHKTEVYNLFEIALKHGAYHAVSGMLFAFFNLQQQLWSDNFRQLNMKDALVDLILQEDENSKYSNINVATAMKWIKSTAGTYEEHVDYFTKRKILVNDKFDTILSHILRYTSSFDLLLPYLLATSVGTKKNAEFRECLAKTLTPELLQEMHNNMLIAISFDNPNACPYAHRQVKYTFKGALMFRATRELHHVMHEAYFFNMPARFECYPDQPYSIETYENHDAAIIEDRIATLMYELAQPYAAGFVELWAQNFKSIDELTHAMPLLNILPLIEKLKKYTEFVATNENELKAHLRFMSDNWSEIKDIYSSISDYVCTIAKRNMRISTNVRRLGIVDEKSPIANKEIQQHHQHAVLPDKLQLSTFSREYLHHSLCFETNQNESEIKLAELKTIDNDLALKQFSYDLDYVSTILPGAINQRVIKGNLFHGLGEIIIKFDKLFQYNNIKSDQNFYEPTYFFRLFFLYPSMRAAAELKNAVALNITTKQEMTTQNALTMQLLKTSMFSSEDMYHFIATTIWQNLNEDIKQKSFKTAQNYQQNILSVIDESLTNYSNVEKIAKLNGTHDNTKELLIQALIDVAEIIGIPGTALNTAMMFSKAYHQRINQQSADRKEKLLEDSLLRSYQNETAIFIAHSIATQVCQLNLSKTEENELLQVITKSLAILLSDINLLKIMKYIGAYHQESQDDMTIKTQYILRVSDLFFNTLKDSEIASLYNASDNVIKAINNLHIDAKHLIEMTPVVETNQFSTQSFRDIESGSSTSASDLDSERSGGSSSKSPKNSLSEEKLSMVPATNNSSAYRKNLIKGSKKSCAVM